MANYQNKDESFQDMNLKKSNLLEDLCDPE